MLDHITVRVSNFEKSKHFYQAALGALSIHLQAEKQGSSASFGFDGQRCFFWIKAAKQAPDVQSFGCLAFTASSRAQVDTFHKNALLAGGMDNGAPGIRKDYHRSYYAAYILDPNGYNIEVVFHDIGNYAFIDAQNLHRSLRKLHLNINFATLRIYLSEVFNVTNALVFIGYIPGNEKIYDYYRTCGYEVRFKNIAHGVRRQVKGNVDAELIVDALGTYYHDYSQAVILSSDGDFAPLVQHLRQKGKFKAVISPDAKNCSQLLKRAVAGRITYIEDILPKLKTHEKRRA